MRGTPLPSAEAAPASRLQRELRRARRVLPRSFRARLAVVISAVVAFALILVLAVLPRLLDSYFAQQETQNLQARAAAVEQLLAAQLRLTARAGLVPIVEPTTPLRLSDDVISALTGADEPGERSFLSVEAQVVAQADLTVAIYPTASATGNPVATLKAPLAAAPGDGLTREAGSVSGSFTVPDLYWSQFSGSAPVRAVVVTLSSPYTLRAETLQTLFTVLIAVAVLALLLAVVVAAIVADRLTTPNSTADPGVARSRRGRFLGAREGLAERVSRDQRAGHRVQPDGRRAPAVDRVHPARS